VTYNFDPDGWYDNQRSILERRLERREIDEDGYREALAELDRRYDEMVARLDGTYRIPGGGGEPSA
jgi:hypothetical protein